MKCTKAEILISKSLDDLLTDEEKDLLERHLGGCPACRIKRKEYAFMMETLRDTEFPVEKPYFWERLQPHLKEQRKFDLWSLWKQWSIRAVPLSIIAVVALGLGLALFYPQPAAELSQTGDLLLSNRLSLPEPINLLEEENNENKSIQLIFMAMEEKKDTRRYFP
jgi:predicted anti-sigma-YlaC factor YlaD